MKTITIITLLILLFSCTVNADQNRPTYNNKVVLFGNLHAHSSLSDDIGGPKDDLISGNAFEYTHENGLAFIAITDHHKATDCNSHKLGISKEEYNRDFKKPENSIQQIFNSNNRPVKLLHNRKVVAGRPIK